MAFRFSNRPHKQFLWFMLRRDSRLSNGRDVGIDAGSADMGNRRFFGTRRYIALDPDESLLNKGKKRYPEAELVHSTIQGGPRMQADFVQCIQVFVNAEFRKEDAVVATRRLIDFTRPGGVLLMNTGKKTLRFDDEILAELRKSFADVKVIRYGNIGVKKAPKALSLALGALMYAVPPLRLIGGHQKTYFCCKNRLA